jgi:hypothetical protein
MQQHPVVRHRGARKLGEDARILSLGSAGDRLAAYIFRFLAESFHRAIYVAKPGWKSNKIILICHPCESRDRVAILRKKPDPAPAFAGMTGKNYVNLCLISNSITGFR